MAVSTHLRALVALPPVPFEYEAGWAPELGCTLCGGGGGRSLAMPVLERRLLGQPIRSLDTVSSELT
jgi:hypothetical protein